MQAVRDEMEKYRELYEDKCRQHQDQLDKHDQVSRLYISSSLT